MDNRIEYLVRVRHNNYTHPENETYDRLHVDRVDNLDPDPCGMLQMCNVLDTDPCSPSYGDNVRARAQGLFARTNEDEILIRFEYLFCGLNGCDPGSCVPHDKGRLEIYLTDTPIMLDHNDPRRDQHYLKVATLLHPPSGRPGSACSGRFGVFHKVVSTGDLNFIRGTRMEFELIGPAGTCIYINNWDPAVYCTSVCGDVANNDTLVNAFDFLTIIGEYGQSIDPDDNGCLDGFFCQNGYVDIYDVMAWDWNDQKNLCGEFYPSSVGSSLCDAGVDCIATESPRPHQLGSDEIEAALLIAGKRFQRDPCDFFSDRVYQFDEQGSCVSEPFTPGVGSDRLNCRLIRDRVGSLYHMNLDYGLQRLSDASPVVPPRVVSFVPDSPDPCDPCTIIVIGLQDPCDDPWGRPILDAAFDAQGDIYVVPVVVLDTEDPNQGYSAAAKLHLEPGQEPPYSVVQLYGEQPLPNDNQDPNQQSEIEVDDNGNVFVINSHQLNEADILWVYDADTGAIKKRLELRNPTTANIHIPAPISMHARNDNSRLYLASALNQPEADSVFLYNFSIDELLQSPTNLVQVDVVEIPGMGHITDITEDPQTAALWVSGFAMSGIPETLKDADTGYNYVDKVCALEEPLFYKPYLASVQTVDHSVEVFPLYDLNDPNVCDLALPLSIVWTPSYNCEGADLDGSYQVDSVDVAMLAECWLAADDIDLIGCGEANLDDRDNLQAIDLADLAVIARHWLESGCHD